MRKPRKKKESEWIKLLRILLQGYKIYTQVMDAIEKYNQEQILIQQKNQLFESLTLQSNSMVVDLKSVATNVVVEKKKRVARRRFKLERKIHGIKPALT